MYYQDLVKEHEQDVLEHQQFTEACNNCITWVRSARETLATSCDAYGDRDTVQAKLEKVKVCKIIKSCSIYCAEC